MQLEVLVIIGLMGLAFLYMAYRFVDADRRAQRAGEKALMALPILERISLRIRNHQMAMQSVDILQLRQLLQEIAQGHFSTRRTVETDLAEDR